MMQQIITHRYYPMPDLCHCSARNDREASHYSSFFFKLNISLP